MQDGLFVHGSMRAVNQHEGLVLDHDQLRGYEERKEYLDYQCEHF